MGATGLASNRTEYRSRLREQSDEQIDAWVAEAMRDMSIRRGVLVVIEDYRRAAHVGEGTLERIYAAGGGPPASVGRTADGRLMVPASTLWAIAAGTRRELPDARERLIAYLVESFDELVFV